MRQEPAGNIKPDKERSRDRIDGISALANALGRALLQDHSDYIYTGRCSSCEGYGDKPMHLGGAPDKKIVVGAGSDGGLLT
jgi:hypothetical protein